MEHSFPPRQCGFRVGYSCKNALHESGTILVMNIFAQIAIPVVCVLIGLLVGRAIERSGKLRFRSSKWKYRSRAEGAGYECRIEIFNDTDKATALNEFLVEFRSGREILLSDRPYCVRYVTKEGAWVPKASTGAESVNLPAREWTTMHLWGSLSEKHAADLRPHKTTVHFVAQLPSGKRKEWRIDGGESKA